MRDYLKLFWDLCVGHKRLMRPVVNLAMFWSSEFYVNIKSCFERKTEWNSKIGCSEDTDKLFMSWLRFLLQLHTNFEFTYFELYSPNKNYLYFSGEIQFPSGF